MSFISNSLFFSSNIPYQLVSTMASTTSTSASASSVTRSGTSSALSGSPCPLSRSFSCSPTLPSSPSYRPTTSATSNSLSLHAGHTVLGLPGGFLMAGTVAASALGSINANIWGGSRLLVIMAQDNTIIPYRVRQPWKARGTQATAILVLVCQAAVHALISLDFKTFSKIYSAVGWSWYGLSIAGLLYLRKRKPEFPRPMKVYWPLALGFVMVAFFLVVGSLTLAFGGSKTDDGAGHGGGGGGGGGGGRWTSVIMFGGAIVFMSGVVPAFYCTRCYNRRKGLQHGLPHQRRDQLQDNHGSSGRIRKKMIKDRQRRTTTATTTRRKFR